MEKALFRSFPGSKKTLKDFSDLPRASYYLLFPPALHNEQFLIELSFFYRFETLLAKRYS